MEDRYYLRIQGEKFGFLIGTGLELHEEVDTEITKEVYEEFKKLQSEGKEFRVKHNSSGSELFDLLEVVEWQI